ncbi:MAG: hypothetical protein U1E70_22750 [Acetobacteraceae bacterium]
MIRALQCRNATSQHLPHLACMFSLSLFAYYVRLFVLSFRFAPVAYLVQEAPMFQYLADLSGLLARGGAPHRRSRRRLGADG